MSASTPNHKHHESIRLPLSLSIIFGSFTLGFYVAIQGPTLMDLIDLLHVNNDIMSHSLAFASLAYSVGGLLSGFLFNYVDRQMLIPAYYVVFGVANILTPYITNYYIFSVITVFKMMCAGGTDCGANVWILDMWPGKDAWLQALHFSFAVGCALGPLVVEPFLSAGEHKDQGMELSFKEGSALINNENTESRIYIPYGVSGSISLLAAAIIVYLYFREEQIKRQEQCKLHNNRITTNLNSINTMMQSSSSGGGGKHQGGENILMLATQHPAVLEAGASLTGGGGGQSTTINVPETIPEEAAVPMLAEEQQQTNQQVQTTTVQQQQQQHQSSQAVDQQQLSQSRAPSRLSQHTQHHNHQHQLGTTNSDSIQNIKFTSKAKDQVDGRPPYYVMFAIALSALCLSFYCGIEITSMNYLATFAVNIDLQLPKSTAALMSSALTISFAVGRLFGIWIAAYMRPHKLFYLCSAVMALGNVFILIFANNTEMFLWYSICLFGIGCGPMYASIVSFYDDKIAKVTNTVSGIFILGSMFNVALNTLIIGHYIIDNALILIVCNLIGAVLLLMLFGSLHMLTKIKKNQRKRKFKLQRMKALDSMGKQQLAVSASSSSSLQAQQQQHQQTTELQVALLEQQLEQTLEHQQQLASSAATNTTTTTNTTTPPLPSSSINQDNEVDNRPQQQTKDATKSNPTKTNTTTTATTTTTSSTPNTKHQHEDEHVSVVVGKTVAATAAAKEPLKSEQQT